MAHKTRLLIKSTFLDLILWEVAIVFQTSKVDFPIEAVIFLVPLFEILEYVQF